MYAHYNKIFKSKWLSAAIIGQFAHHACVIGQDPFLRVLPILESLLFFTKHEKELASNSKNLQEQTLHLKKRLMELSFKVPVCVKKQFCIFFVVVALYDYFQKWPKPSDVEERKIRCFATQSAISKMKKCRWILGNSSK